MKTSALEYEVNPKIYIHRENPLIYTDMDDQNLSSVINWPGLCQAFT